MKYIGVMKRMMGMAVLILLTFIAPANAEQEDKNCFKYEPAGVELIGVMKQDAPPDLSDFASTKKGDEGQPRWFLYFKKPICVKDADDQNREKGNIEKVERVQVIIGSDKTNGGYPEHKYLLGHKVKVDGVLSRVIIGKHKTRILITTNILKPAGREGEPCISYEPEIVSLTGTIKSETYPGYPSFESIKGGDKPTDYWFLYLDEPICLKGNTDQSLMQYDAYSVRKIQLEINSRLSGGYSAHKYLLNKKVKLSGTLYHAIFIWQKTSILIDTYSIKYAGK